MTAPFAAPAALAEFAKGDAGFAHGNSPNLKQVRALGKVLQFRHFSVATDHR
jgi:hypothetical protein